MRKKILMFVACFLFMIPSATIASEQKINNKRLAIVIDDFGNNMKGTEQILNLPIPLTVAVMPFMPSSKKDAQLAHQKGHEVIVHMPMEPKSGKSSWLGPGAITTDLSNEEIRKRTLQAIKNIPHAVGMNNHMGSKITEDKRVMSIILQVCKEQGLYYLDSKTSGNSKAKEIAGLVGVPLLENNYFFDDQYSEAHINLQAKNISLRLQNQNQLIAIGHVGLPGPFTFAALKRNIPMYEKNAQLVKVSHLIPEIKMLDKKFN